MKIGLLDHMGYGNLGDAATQDVLIANIKMRLPSVEIVGFSLDPNDTEKRHHIPSYSITYWHPGLNKPKAEEAEASKPRLQLKYVLKNIPVLSPIALFVRHLVRESVHIVRTLKVLRSLDSLIIAGGGQLGDLWRGPWSHPYNVLKFSALTKLAGRKLLFVNVGAGPLKTRLSKGFVRSSLYLADYVSFRDVQSQELVQQIGVCSKTYVFPDSVYALDVSSYKNAAPPKSSRPLVGINPIGFWDPRIWPQSDALVYSRYIDKLAELCQWLSSLGYRIRIFSAEASVDVYAIQDLKAKIRDFPSTAETDITCAEPSESVRDLLADMSVFDFVVTSKFHGVVFSHLLEKPVVALSYHRKIDDLMQTVGHSQHCLDIANFDLEHLKSAFASMVADAQTLRSRFREIVVFNSNALKPQFDSLFTDERVKLSSRDSSATESEEVLSHSVKGLRSPRSEES
jgi:polysaccharide pyruvyl transferase WcaK-like protein